MCPRNDSIPFHFLRAVILTDKRSINCFVTAVASPDCNSSFLYRAAVSKFEQDLCA